LLKVGIKLNIAICPKWTATESDLEGLDHRITRLRLLLESLARQIRDATYLTFEPKISCRDAQRSAKLVLDALGKTELKTIIPRIMREEFGMFCGEDSCSAISVVRLCNRVSSVVLDAAKK